MVDKETMNVNGDHYLCMLQESCVPELSAVANMQQVIFQQDGAPVHSQAGREKMGNPGMRFPGNFACSWEIFTDFQKTNLR